MLDLLVLVGPEVAKQELCREESPVDLPGGLGLLFQRVSRFHVRGNDLNRAMKAALGSVY